MSCSYLDIAADIFVAMCIEFLHLLLFLYSTIFKNQLVSII